MPPYFIEPQHPKANVAPDRTAINRVMILGFVAQRKVNGHRVQIHVSSDGEFAAFTRQGKPHTAQIPQNIKEHLIAMARPKSGWTCLDGEWQKQESKIYLFDILRLEDELLSSLTFFERFEKLLGIFRIGPGVSILPIIKDVDGVMELMGDGNKFTEGVVLRNPKEIGWQNTAILRCRKTIFFNE